MPSSAIIALLLPVRPRDTRQHVLSNQQVERLRALHSEMRDTTPAWVRTLLGMMEDVSERLERVERRLGVEDGRADRR